jgi:hypothetical protein
MDRISNPYTPGAGAQPAALVGRDHETEAFDAILARAANGLRSRGLVLHGLRGVGKTVLLNDLHSRAQRAGWLAVKIEAQSDDAGRRDVHYTLARELAVAGRAIQSRSQVVTQSLRGALATIAAFGVQAGGVGVELGVAPKRGRADSGDLEVDLRELVEDVAAAMAEQGKGLALFIDELQDLDRGILGPLLSVEHAAMQDGRPFYVIGAGLPSVQTVLTPHDAQALQGPAAAHGVGYQPAALDLLLAAADGYPYFLQVFGSAAWLTAPGPFEITGQDAEIAIVSGTRDLDGGFFSSRWNRATKAQRRFMRAMADDRDLPSSTLDVAARMGVRRGSTSPARGELISKGLVYMPERGMVAFTVPHMAAYISRRPED